MRRAQRYASRTPPAPARSPRASLGPFGGGDRPGGPSLPSSGARGGGNGPPRGSEGDTREPGELWVPIAAAWVRGGVTVAWVKGGVTVAWVKIGAMDAADAIPVAGGPSWPSGDPGTRSYAEEETLLRVRRTGPTPHCPPKEQRGQRQEVMRHRATGFVRRSRLHWA